MQEKTRSFFFHLLPLGAILIAWQFVARWYYHHLPALGVDLYNTASYVSFLSKNFVSKISAWQYIWWSGHPLEGAYPIFHAYFIVPVARLFGVITGLQLYMLATLFLFFLFSYLLFWEVSKSRIFSAVLTIATTFSIAIYGALTWGGSLPYFATQMFFPLSLYLLIKYLHASDKKFLYLSAAVTGLSILGHPQIAIVYIIPCVFLLLALWFDKEIGFFSREKIKDFLIFAAIATLVGYSELYFRTGYGLLFLPFWLISYFFSLLGSFFKPGSAGVPFEGGGAGVGPTPTDINIQRFQRTRLQLFVKETHPFLFVAFFVLLVATFLLVIFSKKRKKVLRTITFASLVLYHVLYVALFAFGFSFFHGGWYRVFWPFPVLLGLLVAWLWKAFSSFLFERFSRSFSRAVWLLASLGLVVAGVVILLTTPTDFFAKLDDHRLAYSEASSAYPLPLNYLIRKDEQEWLKDHLVPEWLDASDREHRLYTADAQVNIWWNVLYQMPLLRGYTDPPIGTERRGGFFWLDVALTKDQLVKSFGVPVEIAKNNTLFLLDWFGIRYIEAEHASASFAPLSSYLKKADIFAKEEEIRFTDRGELFDYYLGKKEVPLQVVNLPVILFVGNESSYLATVEALNLNPDQPEVIIVKGIDYLDEVKREKLDQYDGLILYDYGYRDTTNRTSSYSLIADFAATGKPVWIETGGGVFEADTLHLIPKEELTPYSRNLPALFPLLLTKKEELGRVWELEVADESLKEGIDFNQFSPAVELDENKVEADNWEFSYPPFPTSIEGEARILIKNHGKTVVMEKNFREGKVLWSGMNLPQHAKKHGNSEEKVFFSNLFSHLFDLPKTPEPFFEVTSSSPGELTIKGEWAKGIFMSQEHPDLWSVKLNGKEIPLDLVQFPKEVDGMYINLQPFVKGAAFETNLTYTGKQSLHYFELKDELTSPVLHPTNAQVIGVVGNDSTYESFFRTLGMNNINSKTVIPLKITEPLDNLNASDLANFDLLFLYGYTYKNHAKVWKMLENWVKDGGRLFIETGSDVKETGITTGKYPQKELPSVFPITTTKKEDLGETWEFETENADVLEGVKLESFGPPTLDGEPWLFSLPSETTLREGSKVILRQRGVPILIKRDFGKGKVIWSGMNLAYHVTIHNSIDEGVLMVNLLKKLMSLEEKSIPSDYSVQRRSPQKVMIESGPARGIIFREQAYLGWKAYLSLDKKRGGLKIYKTGPTFHGFIYVAIPPEVASSAFKVDFRFGGSFKGYYYNGLTLVTIFLILDYAFFKGKIVGRRLAPIGLKLKSQVGGWWEKEEEY